MCCAVACLFLFVTSSVLFVCWCAVCNVCGVVVPRVLFWCSLCFVVVICCCVRCLWFVGCSSLRVARCGLCVICCLLSVVG